jgi:hypothetical protein
VVDEPDEDSVVNMGADPLVIRRIRKAPTDLSGFFGQDPEVMGGA